MTLLPDCIEEYIGEDNPVRVIDAFVENLDLVQAGFYGLPQKKQEDLPMTLRIC